MHRTIISDTSCLIVLSNIGQIELLRQLYGQVTITNEIAEEFSEALPDWVEILSVSDKTKQRILELQIDRGEASAIALALESTNTTIIVDDQKARKVAQQLGINHTGTIGVIVKAKLRGIIPSIKPLLSKIKQTDFRLTADLEIEAIRQANETD